MAIKKKQPKVVGRNSSANPKVCFHIKDDCRHARMEGVTLPPNMSKIAKQKKEEDGINMSQKTK